MSGVFGSDEAGKGPVLGPMIAAAVAVVDERVLPAGIDDSKKLSPARREEIDAALRDDERIDVGIAAIAPDRIDDPATNMNTLTVEAHAAAAAQFRVDGRAGIVDAGEVNEARFARRVADRLDGADLTAEHGADERHAVVGAASIVAKVERDARMERLRSEYGSIGSGYPSDPNTRRFLAEYVGEHGVLPDCARASWTTCDDVLAAADQRTLDAF